MFLCSIAFMKVVIVDRAARGQCLSLVKLTDSSGTQTSAGVYSGTKILYYVWFIGASLNYNKTD